MNTQADDVLSRAAAQHPLSEPSPPTQERELGGDLSTLVDRHGQREVVERAAQQMERVREEIARLQRRLSESEVQLSDRERRLAEHDSADRQAARAWRSHNQRLVASHATWLVGGVVFGAVLAYWFEAA